MILPLLLLAAAQDPPKSGTASTGADVRLLFSYDDYPAEALKKNEQGTVQAELTIGSDGRVRACKVIRSSNSESLDTATCNIMMRRARFKPARDAHGNPTEDTYTTPPITWKIVEEPAVVMPQVQPGRYRCAPTGQGGLSQEIVALKRGEEMRVAFRLKDQNPLAQHPAVAGLQLEGPNGTTHILVGRAVNDPFQMFAVLDLPGKPERELYEFPLTNDWIILKLTLDGRGLLIIRNNDQLQRFPLGTATITRTSVHCNSGEWEIDVWPRSYVPAAKEN
jgi:TonB family protein